MRAELKITALVTLICFLATQTVTAAPSAGIEVMAVREVPASMTLSIPSELATIDELYESPAQKADSKFILHIQDAHANYEAQSKIKELLAHLNRQYSIKTVFVEGASEKLNADYLRLFPDEERNRKLAEALAKEGELSGTELYLLEAGKDFEAVGIEEASLYKANYEALKTVFGAEKEIDRFFTGFDRKMGQVSSKVFSPETRELINEWQQFEKGRRDFLPYVKNLVKKAKTILHEDLESLFAQVGWPQITRLLVIQKMEKDLNKNQALAERDKLVQFLRDKRVSKPLVDAVVRFEEGSISVGRSAAQRGENDISPRAVLEHLEREAGPKGFRFSDYPHFSLYAGYVTLKGELDAKALFEEIEYLFTKMLDMLAQEPSQKTLLALYRDGELLRKLLRLELDRNDWRNVLERKNTFGVGPVVARLKEAVASARSQEDSEDRQVMAPEFANRMAAIIDSAFQFYRLACQREDVFFKQMRSVMTERKIRNAVVITGGFHTRGMSDLFRENDVSYGILTPRLSEKIDEKLYRASMLQNRDYPFSVSYLAAALKMVSPESFEAEGGNLAKLFEDYIAAVSQIGNVATDEAVQILNGHLQNLSAGNNNPNAVVEIKLAGSVEGKSQYKLVRRSGQVIEGTLEGVVDVQLGEIGQLTAIENGAVSSPKLRSEVRSASRVSSIKKTVVRHSWAILAAAIWGIFMTFFGFSVDRKVQEDQKILEDLSQKVEFSSTHFDRKGLPHFPQKLSIEPWARKEKERREPIFLRPEDFFRNQAAAVRAEAVDAYLENNWGRIKSESDLDRFITSYFRDGKYGARPDVVQQALWLVSQAAPDVYEFLKERGVKIREAARKDVAASMEGNRVGGNIAWGGNGHIILYDKRNISPTVVATLIVHEVGHGKVTPKNYWELFLRDAALALDAWEKLPRAERGVIDGVEPAFLKGLLNIQPSTGRAFLSEEALVAGYRDTRIAGTVRAIGVFMQSLILGAVMIILAYKLPEQIRKIAAWVMKKMTRAEAIDVENLESAVKVFVKAQQEKGSFIANIRVFIDGEKKELLRWDRKLDGAASLDDFLKEAYLELNIRGVDQVALSFRNAGAGEIQIRSIRARSASGPDAPTARSEVRVDATSVIVEGQKFISEMMALLPSTEEKMARLNWKEVKVENTAKNREQVTASVDEIADLLGRLLKAVDGSPSMPTDKMEIRDAIRLLFEKQGYILRKDLKLYPIHPLQVALSFVEEYGISDKDFVIAALLHDFMEDVPEYTKEPDLIGQQFGLVVQKFVTSLTNKDLTPVAQNWFKSYLAQTTGQKLTGDKENPLDAVMSQIVYQLGVFAKISKSFDTLLLKSADFSSNALKLSNLTPPESLRTEKPKEYIALKKTQARLASKYLGLIQIFQQEFKRMEEDEEKKGATANTTLIRALQERQRIYGEAIPQVEKWASEWDHAGLFADVSEAIQRDLGGMAGLLNKLQAIENFDEESRSEVMGVADLGAMLTTSVLPLLTAFTVKLGQNTDLQLLVIAAISFVGVLSATFYALNELWKALLGEHEDSGKVGKHSKISKPSQGSAPHLLEPALNERIKNEFRGRLDSLKEELRGLEKKMEEIKSRSTEGFSEHDAFQELKRIVWKLRKIEDDLHHLFKDHHANIAYLAHVPYYRFHEMIELKTKDPVTKHKISKAPATALRDLKAAVAMVEKVVELPRSEMRDLPDGSRLITLDSYHQVRGWVTEFMSSYFKLNFTISFYNQSEPIGSPLKRDPLNLAPWAKAWNDFFKIARENEPARVQIIYPPEGQSGSITVTLVPPVSARSEMREGNIAFNAVPQVPSRLLARSMNIFKLNPGADAANNVQILSLNDALELLSRFPASIVPISSDLSFGRKGEKFENINIAKVRSQISSGEIQCIRFPRGIWFIKGKKYTQEAVQDAWRDFIAKERSAELPRVDGFIDGETDPDRDGPPTVIGQQIADVNRFVDEISEINKISPIRDTPAERPHTDKSEPMTVSLAQMGPDADVARIISEIQRLGVLPWPELKAQYREGRFVLEGDPLNSTQHKQILNLIALALSVIFAADDVARSRFVEAVESLPPMLVNREEDGYHKFKEVPAKEVFGEFQPWRDNDKIRGHFLKNKNNGRAHIFSFIDDDLVSDILHMLGQKSVPGKEMLLLSHLRNYFKLIYDLETTPPGDVDGLQETLRKLVYKHESTKFARVVLGRNKVYVGGQWYLDELNPISGLDPNLKKIVVPASQAPTLKAYIDYIEKLSEDERKKSVYIFHDILRFKNRRCFVATREGQIKIYYTSYTYSKIDGQDQVVESVGLAADWDVTRQDWWLWYVKPNIPSINSLSNLAGLRTIQAINDSGDITERQVDRNTGDLEFLRWHALLGMLYTVDGIAATYDETAGKIVPGNESGVWANWARHSWWLQQKSSDPLVEDRKWRRIDIEDPTRLKPPPLGSMINLVGRREKLNAITQEGGALAGSGTFRYEMRMLAEAREKLAAETQELLNPDVLAWYEQTEPKFGDRTALEVVWGILPLEVTDAKTLVTMMTVFYESSRKGTFDLRMFLEKIADVLKQNSGFAVSETAAGVVKVMDRLPEDDEIAALAIQMIMNPQLQFHFVFDVSKISNDQQRAAKKAFETIQKTTDVKNIPINKRLQFSFERDAVSKTKTVASGYKFGELKGTNVTVLVEVAEMASRLVTDEILGTVIEVPSPDVVRYAAVHNQVGIKGAQINLQADRPDTEAELIKSLGDVRAVKKNGRYFEMDNTVLSGLLEILSRIIEAKAVSIAA